MAMSKAPQAFPRTEYLRRIAAVKAEMERRDVDVLMVTSPANNHVSFRLDQQIRICAARPGRFLKEGRANLLHAPDGCTSGHASNVYR